MAASSNRAEPGMGAWVLAALILLWIVFCALTWPAPGRTASWYPVPPGVALDLLRHGHGPRMR